MNVLDLLLLLAAVVVFGLATIKVESRFELVPLGLLLVILVPLINAVDALN